MGKYYRLTILYRGVCIILSLICILISLLLVHNINNLKKGTTFYSKQTSTIYYSERPYYEINILTSTQLIDRWLVSRECYDCWENIRIGSTDYLDAARILSNNPLFGQVIINSPISKSQRYYHLSFTWFEREHNIIITTKMGTALFDTITGKNVFITLNIPSITINEIINKLGEPTNIIVNKIIPFEENHFVIWDIRLIYLDRGIIFSTTLKNSIITEEVEIESVQLFMPGIDGFNASTNSMYKDAMQSWNGYGDYSATPEY